MTLKKGDMVKVSFWIDPMGVHGINEKRIWLGEKRKTIVGHVMAKVDCGWLEDSAINIIIPEDFFGAGLPICLCRGEYEM